jgi:hypothetical protein
MDATFEEVRGLDLPGVSTADEVIVRSSTALAQLMADAVLQTIAVYLARHGSRKEGVKSHPAPQRRASWANGTPSSRTAPSGTPIAGVMLVSGCEARFGM